jgi:hypothetical protein
MMERRLLKRKIVSIKAEVGLIENISEGGIYLVTASSKHAGEFSAGKAANVRFIGPSGATIDLHCNILWGYKTPPHGMTHSVGMEIKTPSQEFTDFYNGL